MTWHTISYQRDRGGVLSIYCSTGMRNKEYEEEKDEKKLNDTYGLGLRMWGEARLVGKWEGATQLYDWKYSVNEEEKKGRL